MRDKLGTDEEWWTMGLHPRTLFIHPSPPSPSSPCLLLAALRLRGVSAPQQVNARILRIHRIERYPIKSRPYLDVNIFEVL
ncbi:hypothetical protein I308_105169 [Cryptococcus tetragattii IND107]|uniref:Uncharacterized protein n=1 Tax=Cryptococcus tetragattii IND107 TaxID=1296105 RepID=A0ABR3BQM2_9TREE